MSWNVFLNGVEVPVFGTYIYISIHHKSVRSTLTAIYLDILQQHQEKMLSEKKKKKKKKKNKRKHKKKSKSSSSESESEDEEKVREKKLKEVCKNQCDWLKTDLQ